ncbi:filamin-binding LIM protein 1 [Coregonus clupeaformis]|uniref:filamin-binding LIM protein 1 n=1 Tax=Coregonus clupeaformis TaxID=59861 RepID=UPI001BDFEB84|nr:filamin-binding LIM protein 1 [Coregonus clupeaformis]
MASAAPQKRMVSSFFITLASPYRATITQHQHTRAHSATANDMPHTATRVGPEDSSTRKLSVSGTQQSTIHRQERALSESQGSTHKGVQSSTPSLARPSEPRTPASPVAPDLNLGLGDSQQQQTQTAADKGPEELLPPPPPPPVFLDAELTEDSTPLLPPPPMQESPTAPLFQHVSSDRPPVSDQLSTAVDRQLEQSTPSSWGEQKEPSQRIEGSQEEQLVTVETKEVCGFCRKPVALSETAIEALNRTYHASCFQCRQCHIPLAGKLYYNKAGIPLCEDCYQASLELCWACGEVIKDHVIRALERVYHPPCFICATCRQPIGEQRFAQGEVGEVYCLQDYYRKYAPQCSACQQLIIPREDGTDSYTVECLGRSFHEDCYRCEVCSTQLSPEPNDYGCHPLDGRVLCKSCHLTMVQSAQL